MIQTQMDRIGEVYEGKYGSDKMREHAILRVDWIVSQVQGQRILDIGCSQGIVGLLLAREGKDITAIDLDPACIAYAQQRISAEPLSVQQHINYLCADFLAIDTDMQPFDTIYVTEVLEHLAEPELCLEKAAKLLAPNGKIVIMVPFGINAHPDHRRTYYYTDLLQAVEKYFRAVAADFVFSWVSVTAVAKSSDEAPHLQADDDLVKRMELAFSDVDSIKHNTITGLKKLNEKLDKQNQTLVSKIDNIEGKFTDALESLTKQYDALRRKEQQTSKGLREEEERYAKLEQQYNKLARSLPGRLVLFTWKAVEAIKAQFRYGDPSKKTIRNMSKKIPGVRPLVLWFRKIRKWL